MPTAAMLILALLGISDLQHLGEATVTEAKPDTHGFLVHEVRSPYQSGTTQVRVLLPSLLEPRKRYPVVYVLPVEAGSESRYGDGLLEVKKQELHRKLQAVFVAPTFSHLPWYADHPTDPAIRQETYFLQVVVPLVEKSHPVEPGGQGRYLLGFSKSGWGAFSLLLRHPDQFAKAAAWDAPLMMDQPGRYGSGPIFGTPRNFQAYRVSDLIKSRAELLRSGSRSVGVPASAGEAGEPAKAGISTSNRLVLLGYGNFRDQHEEAHALLTELRIPHDYRDGPARKHDWHSGWLAEAAALLLATQKDK